MWCFTKGSDPKKKTSCYHVPSLLKKLWLSNSNPRHEPKAYLQYICHGKLEESVLLRLVFRIFQRRADSRRGPQGANVVRQEHKQNLDRRNSPDHLEDLVVHVAVPQQLEFHWYADMLYKNRGGNEVGSQRSVFSWAFLNMSMQVWLDDVVSTHP